MNKQHWKIHFGSFEKFELISGGINNFLGGNFKFRQTSPTPLSSGKNKNCWIISTNLSVSVQQRASAAATMWSKVALLSFFLTVHVYYNSPDMWSYCFWVITHVATTTAAVWGREINWPKYFPLPWNTGAWNSGRRTDETSRQFACCDKRRSLRWFTLIDTLV